MAGSVLQGVGTCFGKGGFNQFTLGFKSFMHLDLRDGVLSPSLRNVFIQGGDEGWWRVVCLHG